MSATERSTSKAQAEQRDLAAAEGALLLEGAVLQVVAILRSAQSVEDTVTIPSSS